MTKLESIKKHGESAPGRKELMNYLKGKVLTVDQAVLARCYDCMSYYADGAADCKMPECPLYLFMPYRVVERKAKQLTKRKAASKKRTNGKFSSTRLVKEKKEKAAYHATEAPKAAQKKKTPPAGTPLEKKERTRIPEKRSKRKSPQPLSLF
jgi:hypothetical protein